MRSLGYLVLEVPSGSNIIPRESGICTSTEYSDLEVARERLEKRDSERCLDSILAPLASSGTLPSHSSRTGSWVLGPALVPETDAHLHLPLALSPFPLTWEGQVP